MRKNSFVFGVLVSSVLALGTMACGSSNPSPAANEGPKADTWDVKAQEQGGSFNASDAARAKLGVDRWSLTFPDKEKIIVEGFDANGAPVGKLEMETAAHRITATAHLDGTTSTGSIAWSDKNEITENTMPTLSKAALDWAQAVSADGDALMAANPQPYGWFDDFFGGCWWAGVKAAVVSVGGAAACAGTGATGGLLVVACAGAVVGVIDAGKDLEKECK